MAPCTTVLKKEMMQANGLDVMLCFPVGVCSTGACGSQVDGAGGGQDKNPSTLLGAAHFCCPFAFKEGRASPQSQTRHQTTCEQPHQISANACTHGGRARTHTIQSEETRAFGTQKKASPPKNAMNGAPPSPPPAAGGAVVGVTPAKASSSKTVTDTIVGTHTHTIVGKRSSKLWREQKKKLHARARPRAAVGPAFKGAHSCPSARPMASS